MPKISLSLLTLIYSFLLFPNFAHAAEKGVFKTALELSERNISECFEKDKEGIYSIFRLSSEFIFTDFAGSNWTVPKDTCVNGASIPRVFWSFIGGPWSGKYRRASVIHDHYVRTKERTWEATHRVFFDGMITSDVPELKAKIMYFAVRRFGPRWNAETKDIPVCVEGNASNCKKWSQNTVRDLVTITPKIPEGNIGEIVPIDQIEQLSIADIELLADKEFKKEIINNF